MCYSHAYLSSQGEACTRIGYTAPHRLLAAVHDSKADAADDNGDAERGDGADGSRCVGGGTLGTLLLSECVVVKKKMGTLLVGNKGLIIK